MQHDGRCAPTPAPGLLPDLPHSGAQRRQRKIWVVELAAIVEVIPENGGVNGNVAMLRKKPVFQAGMGDLRVGRRAIERHRREAAYLGMQGGVRGSAGLRVIREHGAVPSIHHQDRAGVLPANRAVRRDI
ncbi:MAG TPA: hypothetical protein VFF81_12120 [Noviherbaspirillum sp.]|nr:hypothetical protein [Noviherbaspirillum sp.]